MLGWLFDLPRKNFSPPGVSFNLQKSLTIAADQEVFSKKTG